MQTRILFLIRDWLYRLLAVRAEALYGRIKGKKQRP